MTLKGCENDFVTPLVSNVSCILAPQKAKYARRISRLVPTVFMCCLRGCVSMLTYNEKILKTHDKLIKRNCQMYSRRVFEDWKLYQNS